MFLYSLLALAVVTALIFAAPLKAKVWATLAVVAAGALWASATAVGVLAGGHTVRLWATDVFLFGSDAGSMDPLSALFALIVSVGAVAAVLYSRGYLAHYLGRKSPAHISLHYTALATMFYAMLGVVTSEGGFSFLFFWELMTVASFLLILFDAERREVRRAALAYVIMMHVGFALLLIGFVRLDSVCGSADFALLGEYFRTQPALPLFVVFLAGFGMKAGMFPMHVWLPEAHPAAPSHVSALMSGVMIKTGVYGILRVTAQIADLPTLRTAGLILLVAGIVTGLWGVILAAAQNDVKRLLAYSSIENIGIVLIGLGIAALGKSSGNQLAAICGLSGALLHTLNHSLFKSLLFFGAGNILSQTHTTSLDALGGLGRHMPVTGLLFLAGTTAICALPPLNGFVSELLIYLGMLDGIASGSDVLASAAGLAALALIGGVVILAFTKLYGTVFLGAPRTHEVAEASEVDNFRIAAMALPLAGILFIGLFPQTAVSADEEPPASQTVQIGVRHRVQPQPFEPLHLDPVVDDVAQRIDRTVVGQRPFGLVDSPHDAETEPRFIVDLHAHNDVRLLQNHLTGRRLWRGGTPSRTTPSARRRSCNCCRAPRRRRPCAAAKSPASCRPCRARGRFAESPRRRLRRLWPAARRSGGAPAPKAGPS